MKTTHLLLLFFSYLPFTSKSQSIENLGQFETVKADSVGQFSNLSQLDKYFSAAQVVALGEQTHFDGATFDAKVQLVKHLHEQLGFNVLAFESGYFDCTKANEFIRKQQPNVLKEAVFGVWDTKALKDLEAYILQTQTTANPLKVTGFDFQFSGTLAAKYFISDLEAILTRSGVTAILSDPKWEPFKSATARQIKFSNFFKKPSVADSTVIGEMVRLISNTLEAKKGEPEANRKLLARWQLACQNLALDTKHRYQNKNFRDSVMAKNLLWLTSTEFAGEKIICWNATSHFIYNPSLIEEDSYKEFIPMGHHLYQALGKRLYTVGFTSSKGKAGSVIKHKLKSPPAGSIEYALEKANIDYGFVDFSQINKSSGTEDSELHRTRMLGNKFMSMRLHKVVSGLFYIKEAYPPR